MDIFAECRPILLLLMHCISAEHKSPHASPSRCVPQETAKQKNRNASPRKKQNKNDWTCGCDGGTLVALWTFLPIVDLFSYFLCSTSVQNINPRTRSDPVASHRKQQNRKIAMRPTDKRKTKAIGHAAATEERVLCSLLFPRGWLFHRFPSPSAWVRAHARAQPSTRRGKARRPEMLRTRRSGTLRRRDR